MMIRFWLTVLFIALVYDRGVVAVHYGKTLLKTNALGYGRHIKNVAYSANYKVRSGAEGSCVNGPPPDPKSAPNAQTTNRDSTCQALGPCHIGFTNGGDWVAYDFQFDDGDLSEYKDNQGKLPIEVTIRAAAFNNKNRKVDLKLTTKNDALVAEKSVVVRGMGFENFNDIVWKDIRLNSDDKNMRLYITFIEGKTNLCSVDVRIKGYGTNRYVPFAINALNYDDSVELDNKISGKCIAGQPPIDEPDAQTTKDSECRKLGPCQIAFAESHESVAYNFKTNGSGSIRYADISVRVASNAPKNFVMELFHGMDMEADQVEYFRTRGDGYDAFYYVTWDKVPVDTSYHNHRIVVTFSDGNMNMCSIGVEWNDAVTPDVSKHPTTRPTRHPTHAPYQYEPTDTIPITWAAFEYDYAYDTQPDSYQGNCHNMNRDDGVDGSYTNDEICIDRDGSNCYVGWTRPDEWLRYKFYTETDGPHNIRLRVATNYADKKIKLRLIPKQKGPFGKEFVVPDSGWNGFNDIIWKNVYLEKGLYELQIYFVTGYVNLCSTSIYLSNPKPTYHPTPKPTRSPNDNQCSDDESFRYDGDYWKDCGWVKRNDRCDKYQAGWHVGSDKCRKSCGYCSTKHPSNKPTRKPSKHPTKHPTKKPSRKPTPHPTYDENCMDIDGYLFNGDHGKDCDWVATNDRCNRYEKGVHIGKNKCRRTCGYCHHPTSPPTRKPTRRPTRYPTRKPTQYPTSKNPTVSPTTRRPTPDPTPNPTTKPSRPSLSSVPTEELFYYQPPDEPSSTISRPNSSPSNPGTPKCRESALPSIGEIICDPMNNNRFGSLCTILGTSNTTYLKELLSNDGEFTFFVPLNDAVDGIPEVSSSNLINILSYHVVVDQVVESFELECDAKLRMSNNESTTTECVYSVVNGLMVFQVGKGNTADNQPQLVDTDIDACNGILHVVSNIILPDSNN